MMKKLTILSLAVLSFTTTKAQIQFGLKAGANFSTVTGATDGQSASTLIGFNGGILVRLHLNSSWAIQPEALYSGQGAKYSGNSGSGTVNNAYINVPIMLTYSLPLGLSFQAGPQIGILMSAKDNSGGITTDVKPAYKSTDISVAMGAAFTTPFKLGFDARYNLGLTNIQNAQNSNGGSLKNGVFQLGVFYLFGK